MYYKHRRSPAYRTIYFSLSIITIISILLTTASPVIAAPSDEGGFFFNTQKTADYEDAIKELADQSLDNSPLRLRRSAVEILSPVTDEDVKDKGGLSANLVEQITADNADYFFDEGRITSPVVFDHDRDLAKQLVKLLKDNQTPEEEPSAYLEGLLTLLLADRHMAALAIHDAEVALKGADDSERDISPGDINRAEAHLNTAELRFQKGLDALKEAHADNAVLHFSKAWEFSHEVMKVLKLNYSNDSDGDGLLDVLEFRVGSSPNKVDTDDDGLSDQYEVDALIPHTMPDSKDTDGDGLSDDKEDPDDDGLTNREEMVFGSDPLTPDSDGEGLDDGEEAQRETDPWAEDTDQDGLSDASEIRLGTDPADKDTDGDGREDGEDSHHQVLASEEHGVLVELQGIGDHRTDFGVHSLFGVSFFDEVPGLVGHFVDINTGLPVVTARVRLSYKGKGVPSGKEQDLRLLRYDSENHSFSVLSNQEVDIGQDEVVAETDTLGPVGIVYLPEWEAPPQASASTSGGDVMSISNSTTKEDQPQPTPIPSDVRPPSGFSIQSSDLFDEGCDAERCVFQVTTGADDAGIDPRFGSCVESVSENEIYFGECPGGEDITSGFRFRNVTIPQGTQIQRAYLQFTVDGPYTDEMTVVFKAEASGDSQPFSTFNYPSDRNVGQEAVEWHIPSSDFWQLGQTRNSPDITTVVQEILDRGDWQVGNAISIIVENVEPAGGEHRRVIGYERPVWYPGDQYAARLIILLDGLSGDRDQDGLPDIQETNGFLLQNGTIVTTDPDKLDTDGDGIPDGQEVVVTSERTYIISDPNKTDTDGDDVEDFVELRGLPYSLNPFDPDSDDDQLSDGEEVNVYGTDPRVKDTDGDQVSDYVELMNNKDPLRANRRMSALKVGHEFLEGAIKGDFGIGKNDNNNIPFYLGLIISGVISVIPGGIPWVIGFLADSRDLVSAISRGNWVDIGIMTLALAPYIGEATDFTKTTARFLARYPDLGSEVIVLLTRMDWLWKHLTDKQKIELLTNSWSDEVIDLLLNKGFDVARMVRLSEVGVDLKHLALALDDVFNAYPGLAAYLRTVPLTDVGKFDGDLLKASLKGLAESHALGRSQSVIGYLNHIKGAYTQFLSAQERLGEAWRLITKADTLTAAGYDAVVEQGGLYRLLEAKARSTALSKAGISNYFEIINGEILFNTDYLLKHLDGFNPRAILRSGKIEVEFYINSPQSAEVAAKLLNLLGGDVGKYRFEGVEHTVKIIINAVSR